MLDIETLGTAPGSVILSIGAVRFSEGGLGDTFYTTIDIDSSQAAGLKISAPTLCWWLRQNTAALREITRGVHPLPNALKQFSDWLCAHPLAGIWGNGSDFDNALLASAYDAIGVTPPWSHKVNRCYRTIRAANRNLNHMATAKATGTAHHALDDAKNQALHLIAIWSNVESSHGDRTETLTNTENE